jgi:hypothetical protein
LGEQQTTRIAAGAASDQAWKLGDGEVELLDPLAIADLQLHYPRL